MLDAAEMTKTRRRPREVSNDGYVVMIAIQPILTKPTFRQSRR
jgi:hypothetical protein